MIELTFESDQDDKRKQRFRMNRQIELETDYMWRM